MCFEYLPKWCLVVTWLVPCETAGVCHCMARDIFDTFATRQPCFEDASLLESMCLVKTSFFTELFACHVRLRSLGLCCFRHCISSVGLHTHGYYHICHIITDLMSNNMIYQNVLHANC